jgi:hypothetical protein
LSIEGCEKTLIVRSISRRKYTDFGLSMRVSLGRFPADLSDEALAKSDLADHAELIFEVRTQLKSVFEDLRDLREKRPSTLLEIRPVTTSYQSLDFDS